MGTHNTLVANYSRCGTSRARPEDPEDHGPYQYDYGRKLELVGFKDLPQNFEMFFDIGMGKAITRIGTDCVVDIPNVCFERFGELKAWLFLHDSETDGETRYTVKIEIRSRAKTADDEPTPEEQSAITQAIAALNAGVTAAESAQAAAEAAADNAAEDARVAAEDVLTGKANKVDTVLDSTLSHGRKENTEAGAGSVAYGRSVTASGSNSQAFGFMATATGVNSHAIGFNTKASGHHSFASGYSAQATGDRSTAAGDSTIANHRSQKVFGEYNAPDPSEAGTGDRGEYVEIVGNGASNSARSNARTLDWNGNEWIAGSLTVGGALTIGGTTITEEQLQALLAGLTATQVTGNQYNLGLERT